MKNIPNITVPEKLQPFLSKISGNFTFNLPNGFVFQPTYIQAGLIVFLIFLLILTMGSLRHRMAHWSLQGVIPGIGFGFVLTLILEGILIVSGGSLLTNVLGWKNAPKPISNVLDAGRSQLTDVLGVETVVTKHEEEVNPEQVLLDLKSLSPSERDSIINLMCGE